MDPSEQYRIQDAIEAGGLELGAIYHSHTRSDPIPSQTDINLATLRHGRRRSGRSTSSSASSRDEDDVRAVEIADGGYEQRDLEIVET